MNKITNLTSQDTVSENIQTLKQLFPTIVKEGQIDFKELQSLLGDEIVDKEEYYRFTWAGKSQARLEANKPSTATLRPDKESSKNWDSTNNIFIEGDNLEVLKLLQKPYANRIKMIYIDPPYNTGKDFVYKDNYADNLGNYLKITGQTDQDGKKISTNTDSDGRYHSKWLSMIYPRLRLARNLMTDDGAIFISIDDNEQSNLRKVCDEIFGDDNFVASIIWKRKRGRDNSAKHFSKSHEYLFVYSKSKVYFKTNFLELDEGTKEAYKNQDNDPRGIYRMLAVWARGTQGGVEYDFTTKNGQYFTKRLWLFSKDNLVKMDSEDRLILRGNNIYRKLFINENKGKIPETIWDNVSNAANASDELKRIFNNIIFDTPKPIPYISEMLKITTDSQTDDLILDFFAGSGTTSHAVMQLNAEDGGNRKCISVQLPEQTDESSEAYKAGYTNIAEITKERIRRAGEKIKEDYKEKDGIENLDIGFKAFKLDSSNIHAWDGNPEKLKEQLDIFAENIKEDRTEEDLLFEILLKFGLDLTVPIEEKTLANTTVYNVGMGTLFICLSNKITPAVSEEIGKWKTELQPAISRVIFKDTGFETDKDKTNAMQILKRFGIEEVSSI